MESNLNWLFYGFWTLLILNLLFGFLLYRLFEFVTDMHKNLMEHRLDTAEFRADHFGWWPKKHRN